ncbi:MAG TPA: SGNH/GDSL hydrolase family protein [Myxococcota bacterium]|nr:SGNH/GDSL hydrolase family protein [Myxococcota bacterium]
MYTAMFRSPLSIFVQIGGLLIISAVGANASSLDKQRLACFYYDTTKPYDGLHALSPGLLSLWAKGHSEEEVYVEGRVRDGFLKASGMVGKVSGIFGSRLVATYESSFLLAQVFCQRALMHTFPVTYKNKEIVHMGTKSSFLSVEHTPIVFGEPLKFIKTIDKLVVFGDSLSDQGNLKKWLRFFPGVPYFAGRFTNGGVWPDHLGRMTGIAIQNWAVGGSVTDIFIDPEDQKRPFFERAKKRVKEIASGSAALEIKRYIKKSLTADFLLDPGSTLFALWIGANDYIYTVENNRDADTFLDRPLDKRVGSNAVIERVTDNIIKHLKRLHDLGARNFLVGNIPDMGKIPKMLENSSYHKDRNETRNQKLFLLSTKMTDITSRHNTILKKKLDAFMEAHPNSKLVFFDVFLGFSQASNSINFEDGQSYFDYGLAQDLIYEACYENQSVRINKACFSSIGIDDQKAVCEAPDRALFWDGVHPSTFGHCLISSYLHQQAAHLGVFEPSSLLDYLDECLP